MILGFENKHGRRFHVTGHSASGNVNNFGSCSISFMGAMLTQLRLLRQRILAVAKLHPWFWQLSCAMQRNLFSEYRIGAWIILHCITTQYDSSFVLLEFIVQFWIWEMTQVHEKSNNCFAFLDLPRWHLFQSVPFLVHSRCCFRDVLLLQQASANEPNCKDT